MGDFREAQWEEMFTALKKYKARHGDCNVPYRWLVNPRLGAWVATKRYLKKSGRLKTSQEARLKEIGFVFDPHEAKWEEMFTALKKYIERHGDCYVPVNWPENPQLGRWTTKQRKRKKMGKLNSDRQFRLENIGFVFDPWEDKWEEMFTALKDYKKKHGDCNVPRRWPENPQLGVWVNMQRRENRLSEDRKSRLEDIGFVRNLYVNRWEEMFAALKDYKKKHGNCNVPQSWPENPQLGVWVNTQRKVMKKGKLSTVRQKKLGALGFEWSS